MRGKDFLSLLVLAAIWGASFLFIRVAVPVLGPLALMDARVLLAAAALLMYAGAIRYRPIFKGDWGALLMLGGINAALPFTLIAAAELHIPASLAAILNATTPLFAALVAAFWLGDRFTVRKGSGILLGLAGVAMVVGWSPLHLSVPVLIAIGASLGAALSYAVGGVYVKVRFSGAPPLTLSIGQQLAAGLVLLPLAVARPPSHAPSASVVLAVLFLAVLATSFSYLLYFELMTSIGPTNTLTVTFLVPFFGILWSALFLGERIGIGMVLGLALILASIVTVTGLNVIPSRLRQTHESSELPVRVDRERAG